MGTNPIGHIDLRVRDLKSAISFYDELLPAVGYDRTDHGSEWKIWAAGDVPLGAPWVAMIEDAEHRANANRIAFWVDSRTAVDSVGRLLREIGATIESGPRQCDEYSDAYYAVFFEDPSGNKLEVVHRTPSTDPCPPAGAP